MNEVDGGRQKNRSQLTQNILFDLSQQFSLDFRYSLMNCIKRKPDQRTGLSDPLKILVFQAFNNK